MFGLSRVWAEKGKYRLTVSCTVAPRVAVPSKIKLRFSEFVNTGHGAKQSLGFDLPQGTQQQSVYSQYHLFLIRVTSHIPFYFPSVKHSKLSLRRRTSIRSINSSPAFHGTRILPPPHWVHNKCASYIHSIPLYAFQYWHYSLTHAYVSQRWEWR
jgi:hypothetical protein